MKSYGLRYGAVIGLTHPDITLVERCRARDDAAFDTVVDRYKNKLYSYIFRMVGSSEDAEDLTQEVFVRMYTSIESFRTQSSLSTWLFRIANNLCIDHFRRSRKHRAVAYSLDEPTASGDGDSSGVAREIADTSYEPNRLLENQEMGQQIQEALNQLPEKLRTVILLYDLNDMPYDEIAQVIGCPLGTVKSRLFNARIQLRKKLSPYLRG